MSDLIKKYWMQTGFFGVLLVVLFGGYQLLNRVFDTFDKNDERYFIQLEKCDETNSKLAEAIENLGDVLNK